jgi:DNA primase
MTDRMHAAVVSNALKHLVGRVLILKPGHAAKLRARGLSQVEVARLRYVSVPETEAEKQRVADALTPYLDAAGGSVPGFYRERGRWRMVFRPPGIFIPVRDGCGHIQALTQRVDEPRDGCKYIWLSSADREGGASSGAPVHFAGRDLLLYGAAEVTVTEGALKADVASYLSGSPVIGVAGTHATRGLATRLREGFPLLKTVCVAYDRDMVEKPQVLGAAINLGAQLEAEGFEVKVRTWPARYKGIDDYLLAQISSREVAA